MGLNLVAYRLKPVAQAKAVELLEKEFDILPKDPEKTPLQFDLHELQLQSVGLGPRVTPA